jgi:5'-3' exonuclease
MNEEQTWPEVNSVLILVDFSAIAYACWATAEAAEKAGKESLAQHMSTCHLCTPAAGLLPHSLCDTAKLIKQYDPHEVLKTNLRMKMSTIEEHTGEPPGRYVMVLDSHAKWKYDLFANYKGDREERFNPRPEAEAYLREAFPSMQWVRAPGNEADDAIAALVKANKAQRAIVIVSGDKDLWQLLEPKVKLFNSVTKKFLDLETVAKKFYGLQPKHIRLAKALWGDPSDSLPNVAPRQQKQLVPLILESDGGLGALVNLRGKVSEKCFGMLQVGQVQVVKNWKLAGLNPDVQLEWC